MNNLFAFGVICLIGWMAARYFLRRQAISQYAKGHGFVWIGSALPRSLSIEKSSFHTARSIRNAFAGEKDECDFVFFDCRMGPRKASYEQSILAVRSHGIADVSDRFRFEFETERIENWMLIFQKKRAMEVPEIEAIVSAL